MRWPFSYLLYSVLSSRLLSACSWNLSGRFLRWFHNHFQRRSPVSLSSAAMLFTSSRCAHSLFLQPQGSRSTLDSGTTPGKAAGSRNSVLEKNTVAKAHSAWSRIRANRLQTLYDKLNPSARYSRAGMDGSSLVCCHISSLVFFCHS